MKKSIAKLLWQASVTLIIGALAIFFYWKLNTPHFLTFSDGAKMADIARNIISGRGYGSFFSSFGADQKILEHLSKIPFPAFGRQPLMPLFIALSFKIFGITDAAVVYTSSFFYLTAIVSLYFLGRKIFNEKVGFVASIAFIGLPAFWDYALGGASEPLFALEIILVFLLFAIKKKWSYALGLVIAIASYFTRPQGFILISAAILYWLTMVENNWKSIVLKFVGIIVLAAAFDLLVLSRLTGNTFFYSVLSKGADVSVLYTSAAPSTTGLREVLNAKELLTANASVVAKKLFYNLYNLYKLLPSIASPYLIALFVLAIFIKSKSKEEKALKVSTIYMLVLSLVATSLSIPFFRYIHPFLPIIYLFGIAALFAISEKLFIGKKLAIVWGLVSFFVIGQALGAIFLDSRFKADRVNVGEPPVYVKLSQMLEENTNKNSLTVTNLDTWASWYGERRTVWFPTEPMGIIGKDGKIGFDAIYLTSYLMNDENYYMGEGWRQIFENPDSPEMWTCNGCKEIAKEFKLKGIYKVASVDDYEREDATAVLLVRN